MLLPASQQTKQRLHAVELIELIHHLNHLFHGCSCQHHFRQTSEFAFNVLLREWKVRAAAALFHVFDEGAAVLEFGFDAHLVT